jgi:hypothetical protein
MKLFLSILLIFGFLQKFPPFFEVFSVNRNLARWSAVPTGALWKGVGATCGRPYYLS